MLTLGNKWRIGASKPNKLIKVTETFPMVRSFTWTKEVHRKLQVHSLKIKHVLISIFYFLNSLPFSPDLVFSPQNPSHSVTFPLSSSALEFPKRDLPYYHSVFSCLKIGLKVCILNSLWDSSSIVKSQFTHHDIWFIPSCWSIY